MPPARQGFAQRAGVACIALLTLNDLCDRVFEQHRPRERAFHGRAVPWWGRQAHRGDLKASAARYTVEIGTGESTVSGSGRQQTQLLPPALGRSQPLEC